VVLNGIATVDLKKLVASAQVSTRQQTHGSVVPSGIVTADSKEPEASVFLVSGNK
jgi:hypothetical protein